MMKKLAITAAALVLSITAFADDMKIGIVDVRQVLQNSPQVAEMQKKLQQQFADREKQLQTAQQQLQQDADKLSRDAAVMKPADRDALAKKAQAEQDNLRTMQMSMQKDLYAKQNEAMQTILNKMQDIISQIAKSKNLSMVITKDAVAYVANNVDVTQDVIAKMK